jgi:hypothetical protein
MTTLHKFLTFNERCPVCNNPLTLYMQWINSLLFVAENPDSGVHHFTEFKKENISNKIKGDEDDSDHKSIVLMDYEDSFDIAFSHPSLFNEAKKYQIFFYYLCKVQGFYSENLVRNQINLAKGCYYRSTPLMEFKKDPTWKLDYLIPEFSDIVNKDESFCLKTRKDSLDKIYMLSRDMETQTTKVWYFTATDEQRVDPKFRPNIFRKELPLIPRPSLDNQKKLLDRINSWIMIS